ncbi:hypothetical protein BY458DRAFT_429896 [Sporodiniella umbellata]|nr:hypothetical protein BY458DRAFT_429896 [Sporodiniella umbellata]
MLKSNPFLRRASTPGSIVTPETNQHLPVPTAPSRHPGKLSQASLSESALKVPLKPITVKNAQPRTTSIRPSRFVKASTPTCSTSSPLTVTDENKEAGLSHRPNMINFIKMFETFTQKVYMEGYLMRYHETSKEDQKKSRTKMFVELCGSTLILWDTEATGSYVMPIYIQIPDTTTVHGYSTEIVAKKTKHTWSLNNSKTNITFETSDHASMVKWVCAVRLSCFEKQQLHQLFTHKLLIHREEMEARNTIQSAYLQVKLPGTTLWQKYWVVLNEGKKAKSNKGIALYESKKSKHPVLTLEEITRVHAVYPESSQLIENGSMIRVDCTLKKKEKAACWFMADQYQLTIQWLFSIYDLFKLYGRPASLLRDSSNSLSLNFGEPVQVVSQAQQRLFLEVDQVVDNISTWPISNQESETLFLQLIQRNSSLEQPIVRPNGARAHSLPLITVMTADAPSSVGSLENAEESESLETATDGLASFRFVRNVADSSDESDQEEDEDEDGEEDEEDPDSDDEPIGRKTSRVNSTLLTPSVTSLADSLIPDFDFGNGFDVPKDATGAAILAPVVHASSSTSSSSITTPSSLEEDDLTPKKRTRKLSMPIHATVPSSAHTQSNSKASMFGDFSLATDFSKFLDLPIEHQRKFSLPAKLSFDRDTRSIAPSTRSIHTHNRINRGNHVWETEWHEDPLEEGEEPLSGRSKHPFDEDSYDSDLDGPMIPSLGDHFAPQNSLLDNYLGEQLSAKEQVEYAKATGQPLIQVCTKKQGAPQGGLVGVISQREKNKKEGNGFRVAERVNQHHQDRFEREKERRILEQRQQQIMKHQMMLYANGYGMPMMPFINPMANMGPMGNHMGMMNMMPNFPASANPSHQTMPQHMRLNSGPPNPYMSHVRPMYGPHNTMVYGYQTPSLSAPLMNRKQSYPASELLEETDKALLKKHPSMSSSPNSVHT